MAIRFLAFGLGLLCLLAGSGGVLAQTPNQVIPGYLATGAACGSGLSPCFIPNGPSLSALNITTATTVKAAPGKIGTVCLNTVAGTASSVIDSTGTSVTAANTVLTLPSTTAAGTCVRLDWPVTAGIGVVPGTSGVLSIAYQ